MNYKLKQGFSITGLLPAIVSVTVFILVILLWNVNSAFNILGYIILIYAILSFYIYYRTKHKPSIISTIYLIAYGATLLSIAPQVALDKHVVFIKETKVLIAVTIILFNYLLYLNYKRKLKWRGKEILELAAKNIKEGDGNYTERPLPTGTVNYTTSDLKEFAHFFQQNLLGLTYIEESRIVFHPLKNKNEYNALFNPNYKYKEKTWIAFNFNGNVSVNISKEDYLDYKEDLAFEQLCNSFNDLIIEFIDLYIAGKDVRIIDQMNNLKINLFS